MIRRERIAVLLALGLFACGNPRASVGVAKKLTVPRYESPDVGFSLFDASGERAFFGQLLIWDPLVTAKQVTNTLRLKRIANETMVERLRAWDSFFVETLAPARLALETAVDARRATEQLSSVRVRRDSLSLTRVWLEGRIEVLTRVGSLPVAQYSEHALARYCEAKLFSFAASAPLAQMKFRERPTPSALCEGAYSKAGLFASQDCAPSNDGKNYFACIWQDGLLRSKIADRYTREQRDQIARLASEPGLARIFAGSVDEGCALYRMRGNNRIRVSATPEIIVNHLMNGQKGQDFVCNGVSGSFSLGDAPVDAAPVDKISPAKIVDDVETKSDDCTATFCLVPQSLPDGSIVSADALALGKEISRQLFSFGRQSLSCGATRSGWWNKNFQIFNAPISVPAFVESTCNEPEERELPPVVLRDEELSRSMKNALDAQRNFDAEKSKACLSFDSSCDAQSPLNILAEAERNATTTAAEAALEPGVALTFIPGFSVATSRSGNGVSAVRLGFDSFGKSRAWRGCFVDGKPISCSESNAEAGSELPIRRVEVNESTGVLRIEIYLDDVAVFSRKDGSISRNVASDFPGSILQLELLPARMGAFLLYVSGKVTVTKNGRELYQGVAYGIDDALDKGHRRIYFGDEAKR